MVESISKNDPSPAIAAQLSDLLEAGDYTKALKVSSSSKAQKTKNPTFLIIKAFCLMKQGKHADCNEIITAMKPVTLNLIDPFTVRHLVFILTAFSQNASATVVLENAFETHSGRSDLGEQLFFAYVREGKTVQQ